MFRDVDMSITDTLTDLTRRKHIPEPAKHMLKWLKRLLITLVLTGGAALAGVWYAFGGGEPYPDLTTAPTLPEGTTEAVVTSDRPIGNAAVSATGRIFYTIHPESQPSRPLLYEWVDGKPREFPGHVRKLGLFQSPLGLVVDRQNRLWVIDTGHHGLGQPKLVAINLDTAWPDQVFYIPSDIAPLGSFLQDLQIDSKGETVYIADVGFWAKRPAIIAYDVAKNRARRVLNRHPSVYPQNLLIRTQIRDMSYLGGILQLKTGIDGIALSRDDKWFYCGAMNHKTLFRIETRYLKDASLDDQALALHIEAVGTKPLNDGLSIDDQNNVLITDVEHRAIVMMKPDGTLETLIKDSRIRWADGLSFGPDGWLYVADSAIPHLILQSPDHIARQAPYHIWRFKPGTSGWPGQ